MLGLHQQHMSYQSNWILSWLLILEHSIYSDFVAVTL